MFTDTLHFRSTVWVKLERIRGGVWRADVDADADARQWSVKRATWAAGVRPASHIYDKSMQAQKLNSTYYVQW